MLSTELIICEQLAREAGARALALQHVGTVHYKDNAQGPVTQGDLAANDIICSGLARHFPNDLIISEESFDSSMVPIPAHGRVWFVDPIDGTIDYVAGGQEYAVMI